MEINGVIRTICDTQSGTSKSGKAWQKRDFVVEEDFGNFPNSLAITAFGDRVEKLNTYKVGDKVSVRYDTQAKEYGGRLFNNVNLYDIQSLQSAQPQAYVGAPQQPAMVTQPQAQYQPTQQSLFNPNAPAQAQPVFPVGAQGGDDLPF